MNRRKVIIGLLVLLAIVFPYIVPNPGFWVTNGGTRTLWIGLVALSMAYLNSSSRE